MNPGRRKRCFTILCALTIGAFLAENFLYFPLSVPYMKDLAAGAPLLDMRPGYSPIAARQLFDALGETGRASYLRLLWTVDLLLPALFGIFLSSLIRRGAFRPCHLIPLVAAACDYAENITLTILLLRYPAYEPDFVRVASAFTVTKLALYALGMLLAIVGLLVRFARPSRQKGSNRV